MMFWCPYRQSMYFNVLDLFSDGLPDIGDDVFAVLLADKFCLPYDGRYICDGITERSGDVVRFVSDDVRHQVMYSYVVSKLLTDDDMRTFIDTASVDCLMEYGRLWRYTRKEGERCLFIPDDMEELYFKKLGYKAMVHVLFNDSSLKMTTWKQVASLSMCNIDIIIFTGVRQGFHWYLNTTTLKTLMQNQIYPPYSIVSP
jgi:hypothetical protein